MEGLAKDVPNGKDDWYLAYSEGEEVELSLREEEEDEKVSSTEDPDIDDYCRQFVDFMQAQFHKKYDLRSSRKRTRTQDQEEESPPKESAFQNIDKRCKKSVEEPSGQKCTPSPSSKLVPDPLANPKHIPTDEKPPVLPKEPKDTIVEKGPIVFNLKKELEKVKILVP